MIENLMHMLFLRHPTFSRLKENVMIDFKRALLRVIRKYTLDAVV